jgi:hypothetical protein
MPWLTPFTRQHPFVSASRIGGRKRGFSWDEAFRHIPVDILPIKEEDMLNLNRAGQE